MAALNPYVTPSAQARMGTGYGGGSPYGSGYGNYGRYRHDLQGAVTGPVGSSSSAGVAQAEGRQYAQNLQAQA